MRPDFLTKKAMSRAVNDSLNYQLKRGRLSSLLFINSMSWHFADRITIKLRTPYGAVVTVVDRISALLLLQLCDLKQGKTTTGTNNFNSDLDNAGHEATNPGQIYTDNAFLLPLGHLTLDNCELEIIVETAAQIPTDGTKPLTGVVKICSVETATAIDCLYTYDINKDLENTAHDVREMYLVEASNGSFFTQEAVTGNIIAKDVICRIIVDGSSYEVDIEVLGAITSITGELSQAPNGLIKCFVESGSLGATVALKVFGDDSATATVLYVKETVIPGMAANSVRSAIHLEQTKVEALTARNPDAAQALQAAGKISTPEVLAAAKANLPAPLMLAA